MGLPADWIVPDWPAPAGVHALFTTRAGGVSAPPFDSFNLGDHVRDDPSAVAANRARLGAVLGGARPVFLQQVHGTALATLSAATVDGTVADACVSTQPGVACTIMVADCLPVLLAHRSGMMVAAAHAGWRGLASGVLETAVNGLVAAVQAQEAGLPPEAIVRDAMAWLGPCIGPDAFEVGPEVRDAFTGAMSEAGVHFAPRGTGGNGSAIKYLANLPGLARQRLRALGLHAIHGNDGTPPWCTVGQPSRFFSHRRDAAVLGSTGRMAACIWLG
ncbi:peptidoglycan editing factor PgeF [Hydrogenophaga sp.]|uniref:peptidoglycan editing factor PgeF n=1 Tax=Hydrogenophaga sp. TaxID=1904254 RepID=UPI00262C8851|nr:peptidoglycan editing factor PgeF [Hydrogenophaga sp.]MCW5652234.1 peptidoglycan editing factor PgeF [Hydrogenophaga sp.]